MDIKCCFKPASQSTKASTALLILRLVAGAAMMIHGWGKIQNPMAWMGPESPVPGVLQLLAAVSEFGGGLAWILGLLTHLASLGVFFTMIVATYMHAMVFGDPFVSKGAGSYELAALYAAISLVFMFVGPGKFAADKFIFGEK